jgi:hypothetical protein
METVSDNSRGRGRPRKYEHDPTDTAWLREYVRYESDPVRGVTGERSSTTTRHQQNIILAQRALDRIGEDEPYSGAAYDIPQTVRTELGRIEDPDLFQEAVLWYFTYGHNFRVHDAAKIVRDNRRKHA